MKQYLDLGKEIVGRGEERPTRTGIDALSLFGRQLRFDLQRGFPLVTTKRVWFKAVKAELLWFLSGSTNVRPLQEQGVRIWDAWADEDGELGPVYGAQWREWPTPNAVGRRSWIDQIDVVVKAIKNDPGSRRLIVSAWNVGELQMMALPPCHLLFQFYCHGDGRLSCHLYQRSADYFIGVPFNVASYALLTSMVAHVTGRTVGELVVSFGDVHLYATHVDPFLNQAKREPRPLPTIAVNEHVSDLDDFKAGDVKLKCYDPHPAIKAVVPV